MESESLPFDFIYSIPKRIRKVPRSLLKRVRSRLADRKKNLIELIFLGEKQHIHVLIRTNDLFSKIKETLPDGSKINIDVQPRDLYEVPGGLLGFIPWIIKGQKNHYLLVVNKEGEPIIETAPAISGKVLRVARDWKGLGKAIKDSFGGQFEVPRLALVIAIALGVGVIAFLILRGDIPLPASWGT